MFETTWTVILCQCFPSLRKDTSTVSLVRVCLCAAQNYKDSLVEGFHTLKKYLRKSLPKWRCPGFTYFGVDFHIFKNPTPRSINLRHCVCSIVTSALTGKGQYGIAQSTYVYRVPQCMSLRQNWDSSTPFPSSDCAPPPGTWGGGVGTLAYGWGSGGVPIPTTGEKA